MKKLTSSLREALQLSGLADGMTICFHHHLRNGDLVYDMVMREVEALGIKGLHLVKSAIFSCDTTLIRHIEEGIVVSIDTNYISGDIGKQLAAAPLEEPVRFRSHGHYDAAIDTGEISIDLAVIAAPTCDPMGNLSGKYGPSACGSLGYAFTPASRAKRVIAVTDNLVPYPLADYSICETDVDYVVEVERIGNRSGIVSGTTKITKDPVGLQIGRNVCTCIEHSGLFKDGFSFQTGAGGISLAAAQFLKDRMAARNVHGSFIMGGVTKFSVDLLREGHFDVLYDTQCMDLAAVESLIQDAGHREVSNRHYASPAVKSCIVQSLDAAVLGATEIDLDFNVNVHTDSSGYILGGSGGHSDIAACCSLAIAVAPLWRARLPIVKERVTCVSTPGRTIDLFVCQFGAAVNPCRPDLRERLLDAGIRLSSIEELKERAEQCTGIPAPIRFQNKPIAEVYYRDGTLLDRIYAPEDS